MGTPGTIQKSKSENYSKILFEIRNDNYAFSTDAKIT